MEPFVREPGPVVPQNTGGGISDRYLPDFFVLGTHIREKFGAARISPDWAIQEWGITYDEFEKDYWRAEQLLGISGKAGKVGG